MTPAEVVEVPAPATHDLRRRVLRENRADADVDYAEDRVAGAFHLAVLGGGGAAPVAVASFYPEPTPWREGRRAVRLRGMAVEPDRRGEGLGRLVLAAGVGRLRADGVEVLWANARDTALGFYQRAGMTVVGEGFVTVGLPHHVVVLDL